jgi:hypothetical protein
MYDAAMKIQISEMMHDALKDLRPQFIMQKRGDIDVKVVYAAIYTCVIANFLIVQGSHESFCVVLIKLECFNMQ